MPARRYALNDPVANIDAGGLGVVELPELTVFAKAPGMLSSLGHIASKLFTGAASIAGNAGSVLGNIAPMAGELGTLTHLGIELEHTLTVIDGWYVDKNGQIQFSKNVNSSMDAAKLGGHYLGQTYKGIVMANGMKYAFSGGANGSATLSRSLNPVNVVAYKPRGAGAFGPYIPSERVNEIEILTIGTIVTTGTDLLPLLAGEGSIDVVGGLSGIVSRLFSRVSLKAAMRRAGINIAAQTVGNQILHPHESLLASFKRVNFISVGASFGGINFLGNAIYSSSFNLSIMNKYQSVFNGGLLFGESTRGIVGGAALGGTENFIESLDREYPSIFDYGAQFSLETVGTLLHF